MTSLVFGQYVNGILVYCGHVMLGVGGEIFRRVKAIPSRNAPPFAAPSGNENAVWAAPVLVCTVKYMEKTGHGVMRQPVFKGLRDNKMYRPFYCPLPVIAIYGLFGWMSGGEVAEIVGYDAIYQNLPAEIREQIDENGIQLDVIETVFRENSLSDEDISKAKLIYLSCLADKCGEDGFYQRFANCFLMVSEDCGLLSNVFSAFGIEFSDTDRQQFNKYFGGV